MNAIEYLEVTFRLINALSAPYNDFDIVEKSMLSAYRKKIVGIREILEDDYNDLIDSFGLENLLSDED